MVVRFVRLSLALAGVLALVSLVGMSSALALPLRQEETVEMQDFVFAPDEITVEAGTSITFDNTGERPHTATAEDGSFDTGNVEPGDSGVVTLDDPGTYSYICTYHESQGMVGTIIVEAAQESPEPSPSPDESPSPSPDESPEASPSPAPELPDTGASDGSIALLVGLAGCALLLGGALSYGLRRRSTAP